MFPRTPSIILRCSLLALLGAIMALAAACGNSRASSAAASAAPAAGNLKIGDKLPEFSLPTLEGGTVRLADYLDGTRYVCVIWHSPACPCAHNCAIAVRDGLSGPDYADVAFLGVASGPESDLDWWRADLKTQLDEGIVTYPVGIDRDASVRALYGAQRTPTVWLADKQGRIRFWGAPESTLDPADEKYRLCLKDAIDDLKAGRDVSTPTVPPIGCLIPG